jgi:hypothetical protein
MVEPGPNSHDAGLGADAPQLCNNRINVTQIATRAIWNVLRRISIVVFYARQSALPPKADMCGAARDVRFGPEADIARCRTISGIDSSAQRARRKSLTARYCRTGGGALPTLSAQLTRSEPILAAICGVSEKSSVCSASSVKRSITDCWCKSLPIL